jgi:hypothetical protein
MTKETDSARVSDIDADTWEHDEETGGLVHMIRSVDAIQVGLWKSGKIAVLTVPAM